ncbi:MAG: endonuclease domain-containing protein [Dehalococcoidales bacterium]|jgi:very-short-patch-repair endonuclease
MLPYNPKLKQLSRELRKNMTDAEKVLWSKLRMKQLQGLLFSRQKPLGAYIADFYCYQAKLVIEVDGGQHFTNDSVEYDRIRDEFMGSLGLTVLRFTNTDVLQNIEGVLEVIGRNLPPPLFTKEGNSSSPFRKVADSV